MDIMTETKVNRISGYTALVLDLILLASNIGCFYLIAVKSMYMIFWLEIPLFICTLIYQFGFFVVQPNEARALVLFGKYIGSERHDGFWWANPFAMKRHITFRIRNFNSDKIKVNDFYGNPIEIAAVIVWRVIDSAKALFDINDFEKFVAIQSETAIRGIASEFPYDSQDNEPISLRGNPAQIADLLKQELKTRLIVAGVEVIESRISYLAYAPEIAQLMLRRQQAQAIISARRKIVEGAVGMVQDALHMLSEKHIVELDEDKKATMVNNLMVALVSESEIQPIINTGTLYQ
jgi:regulator of protease activity HflC (stomatin/prohibitin superfamily)